MARTTGKSTTDREEIRRWAEERGGKPAHVKRTGNEEDVGILRIDFPGYSGEDSLEAISWDDWFDKFEERGLALIYQETTAGGEQSNFNKIVSRDTAESGQSRSRSRGRTSSSRTSSRAARSSARTSSSRPASKKSAKKKSAKKVTGRKTAARKSTRSASTRAKSAGRKSSSRSASRTANSRSRAASTSKKKSASTKSVRGRHTATARGRSTNSRRAA